MDIKKIVRQVLNEELGINNEVLKFSNDAISKISNSSKLMVQNSDVINNKVGSDTIYYNYNGSSITIIYSVFSFKTNNDYINYCETVKDLRNASTMSTSKADDTLVRINYVVFENGDNNLFYEQIQHELNHVFQQIFQKGKYKYGKIRTNIEKNKKEINLDKELKCASFILYMSRNFEQDGFANSLYGLLLNCNGDINAIKNSGTIHNLRQLQNALRLFKNVDDNKKFSRVFGASKNRIVKIGEKSLDRLHRLINRVIFKYGKDTGNVIRYGNLW